jgi:hypothetical protein
MQLIEEGQIWIRRDGFLTHPNADWTDILGAGVAEVTGLTPHGFVLCRDRGPERRQKVFRQDRFREQYVQLGEQRATVILLGMGRSKKGGQG